MITCLTLEWAGRTWRLASKAFDVVDRFGISHHYDGALPAIDVVEKWELADDSSPDTYDIEVILPGAAYKVSLNHPLEGSWAEVARYDGGTWEEREILTAGWVRDPSYGPEGEPVRISISGDPGEDAASFPATSAMVSEETSSAWTTAYLPAPGAEGTGYPQVFGYPGAFRPGGVAWAHVPGSPLPVVYVDPAGAYLYAVASIGQCRAQRVTSGDRVWIINSDTGDEDYLAAAGVSYPLDDLGQQITVFRLSNVAGRGQAVFAGYTPGDALWVSWWSGTTPAGHGLGGGTSRYDQVLEFAGDIWRWCMERSSLPVDWARSGVAIDALRGYQLGGYWQTPQSPWGWVRDNLRPILPMSTRWGPDGLYPVVWRWWAGDLSSAAHLEVGRNCSWVSGPTWERSEDVVDSVSIRYCQRADDQKYLQSRTIQAPIPDGRGLSSSLLARQVGRKATGFTLDSPLIWSPTTAGLSAGHLLASKAIAPRFVTLRIDPESTLKIGDQVNTTYAFASLSKALGSICQRRRSGAVTEIRIRLVPPGLRWL